MECPNCNSPLSMTKRVMKDELVSMAMEWQGDMVEARTIGGIIENTRKLLAASAKEVGIPCDIFMHSIEWGDKRATFNFLVVPTAGSEGG